MSEGRFGDLSAALLVGGASTRMGRDKSHVELGARPSAAVLAGHLRALCDDVLLVGGSPPDGAPGRRIDDPQGPASAMRGLVGALRAAAQPKVLVVATDYFGLDLRFLLALLAVPEADAVVPRDENLHPLCAVYRREAALAVAEEAFAAGRLRLDGVLASLETRFLAGAELARVSRGGLALRNVNTPDELDAFRREARA